MKLVQVGPRRWRFVRPTVPPARSDLPCPYVISDTMDATEQVDGKFYTSKSAFRRVGKQLGLIEVGNEKPKAKTVRATDQAKVKKARQATIGKAISDYRAGRRAKIDASEGR